MKIIQPKINYKKLLEDINNKVHTKQASENTLRGLCLTDLYFLGAYGCNLKFFKEPGYINWFYTLCTYIQNNPYNTVNLWFRGSGKSTIITKLLSIQEALNDPKLSTGIFSFRQTAAAAFLRSIKAMLESSKMLNILFSHIIPQGRDRNSMMTTEKIRLYGFDNSRHEDNFNAWGFYEGLPTGMHHDRRRYDDIVTKDSVKTRASLMRTQEQFELSTALGSLKVKDTIVGTIYDKADIFNTFFKKNEYYKTLIIPVYINKNFFYYNKKQVQNLLRNMGSFTFGCQMMLDPISKESVVFGNVVYYDNLPKDKLDWYVFMDPAVSEKRGTDNCAIVTMGVNKENCIYVDRVISLKEKEKKSDNIIKVFVYEVFRVINKKYNLRACGVESNGLQILIFERIIQALTEEARVKHIVKPKVYELKPKGRSKYDRILRLQPDYECGKFLIRREKYLEPYEPKYIRDNFKLEELHKMICDYPQTMHDDELDCCAYIKDFLKEIKTNDIEEENINQIKRININRTRMVSNKNREKQSKWIVNEQGIKEMVV